MPIASRLLALAPLALLAPPAALAAPAPINWAAGTPVLVTMTNDGFVPARLVLRAGRQYVLRIRNPSSRGHTFAAKDFFAQARVAPRDGYLVTRNELELKPGQSARLRLIAPTTPGALYTFRSTRVADAAEKYKGEIVVR